MAPRLLRLIDALSRRSRALRALRDLTATAKQRLGLHSNRALLAWGWRYALSLVRAGADPLPGEAPTAELATVYGPAEPVPPPIKLLIAVAGERVDLLRPLLVDWIHRLPADQVRLGLLIDSARLAGPAALELQGLAALWRRPLELVLLSGVLPLRGQLPAAAAALRGPQQRLWLVEGLPAREVEGLPAREPADLLATLQGPAQRQGALPGLDAAGQALFLDPVRLGLAPEPPARLASPWALAGPRLGPWAPLLDAGRRGLMALGHQLHRLGWLPAPARLTLQRRWQLPAGGEWITGTVCDPDQRILALRDPASGENLWPRCQQWPLPPAGPALLAAPSGPLRGWGLCTEAILATDGLWLETVASPPRWLPLRGCPAAPRRAAAEELLGELPLSDPRLPAWLDGGLGTALRRFPPEPVSPAVDRRQYGPPPPAPGVSLIIPLYGRWDFMQHQLALFADDPALDGAELIYVIDDPALEAVIAEQAPAWQALFGRSFLTLSRGCNQGYAAANNLGAAQARAPRLLLLNSDVMPAAPGWLAPLLAALDTPHTAAVGARLLYEDDTVQHNGMVARPCIDWGGLLLNHHPGKGLPERLLPAPAVREVPLLTGACLLLRRADYLAVGGLDERFLIGDFEDSLLCQRLQAGGGVLRLCEGVRLYHLERQSMGSAGSAERRARFTLYNAWLAGQLATEPLGAAA